MRRFKRAVSWMLVFLMVVTSAPTVFAGQADTGNDEVSWFDFDASEYSTSEDAGTFKVRVVRNGDGNAEANVSFKAADFLSTYGEDYVILDEDGNELEKVKGEKPDISEFECVEADGIYTIQMKSQAQLSAETAEAEAIDDEQAAESEPEAADDQNTDAEAAEGDSDAAADDSAVESEPEAAEPAQTESGKLNTSKGSRLLDAQAAQLGLPAETSADEVESAIGDAMDSLLEYFLAAEGAGGVLHFKKGEKEKYITIKLLNNEKSNASRIFMMALLGTDNDLTDVAVNATTYITIDDDEEAEGAEYSLSGKVNLTSANPTGRITITRSGNADGFSKLYLTTVKGTVSESSYEAMDAKAVYFLPGETAKEVEVKALSFNETGYFGIRLEADSTSDTIGKHYLRIGIGQEVQEETASLQSTAALQSATASLMETGYLGLDVIKYGIAIGGSEEWYRDVTGGDDDNYAYVSNGKLYVGNYDEDKHSCLGSARTMDFTGIKELRAWIDLNSSDKNHHTTHFRVGDGTNYYGAYDAQWVKSGKFAEWASVDTSKINRSTHVRFEVTPDDWGKHNPKGWLDNIQSVWAKYTFSPQMSAQTFSREIYDYTAGTPAIYQTVYDGESGRLYNPGTVKVTYNNAEVKGFYANSNNTVSISVADEYKAKNEKNGYYLAGVYFASDSHNAHSVYQDGKYNNSKVYYVEAVGGTVKVNLNQSFTKTLIDKKVISSENADENIKIYPVFKQKTVTVNFFNADRPDGSTKYDSNNLYTHFANVDQAGYKHNTGESEFFSAEIPYGTVIRLKTVTGSDRVANGATWGVKKEVKGHTYYKQGDLCYGENGKTVTITQTDYTMSEVVADTDMMVITPASNQQTFYIGYSPKSVSQMKKTLGGSLEGYVNSVVDGNIEQISNADGSIQLNDPYIGKNYTFNVYAPSQYYTSWANMTGDTNNDGNVTAAEAAAAATTPDKSSNPQYVYGNVFSMTLDQDNTRYYYSFVEKSNSGAYDQTGTVRREDTTFYKLANNIKTTSYVPVVAANVDIAGFKTMTDLDGKYSVTLSGLPDWGTISAAVYLNNDIYSTVASIERPTVITIPALEKFKAVSLAADYDKNDSYISSNFITAVDDNLTLSATIKSENAVTPKSAEFFVYDKEGNLKLECTGREGYTTKIENINGNLVARLTFNPKADISQGDKVYVRFSDTNDHWYEPIDLGYTFFAELTLDKFIFPMLGCTTLDQAVSSGIIYELIGNPLGGINLGSISAFKTSTSSYTPSGIPESSKSQYTWQRTSYSFGWDMHYGPMVASALGKGSSASDSDKASLMDGAGDAANSGGGKTDDSKYSTQTKFKWSLTPSVGFNLTLSNRQDGTVCFEDLTFYLGADFGLTFRQNIALPIGISVVLGVTLDGSVKAIYHMYNDYQDIYETEDATPYTSEDFGLFKSFNNSVRREGYIFLDPAVRFKFGVTVAILTITGKADFIFDMDFQFTETGVNSYGQMNIDLGYGIELFAFEVYSSVIKEWQVKLFSGGDAEGPIDFDTETTAALNSVFKVNSEDVSLNTASSRDYLNNRSEWTPAMASLKSADTSEGTEIFTLRTGTEDNASAEMYAIDDNGTMLLMFLDDDTTRSDINRTAVYYTIGTDNNWAEPVLLEDDGTLDAYLTTEDLGNGKIFVSWTSLERALDEGEGVSEAMSTANIHAAVFDKNTRTFGDIVEVTKKTDEDISANLLPVISYNPVTEEVNVIYEKLEYGDIESYEELVSVEPILAYRSITISDGTKLTCSGGDSYTEEEEKNIVASGYNLEDYKKNWYGQRFVDLRTSSESVNTMEFLDFDAKNIHVEGETAEDSLDYIAVAWVVDWDGDQENTIDDRDVFLRMYDCETCTFSKVIKVSENTGIYTRPQIAGTSDCRYLFYGTCDENGENSRIDYINITDIFLNEKYTVVEDEGFEYCELSYTPAPVEHENGETHERAEQWVEAQTAVCTEDISDFEVLVEQDVMSLFWTESDGTARNICCAVYYGSDAAEKNPEGEGSATAPESSFIDGAGWSDTFVLTKHEDEVYYMGINPVISGGKIYIAAGRGNYNDKSDTAFVLLKHTPYSKLEITDLWVEESENAPGVGDLVTLVAEVKNTGILALDEKATLIFGNGETTVSETKKIELAGGDTTTVRANIEAPDSDPYVFTVKDADDNSKSVEVARASDVSVNRELIWSHPLSEEMFVYSGSLVNKGNKDSGNITVKAFIGNEEIASEEYGSLEYDDRAAVNLPMVIPSSKLEYGNGLAKADVTVKIYEGDKEVSTLESTAEKAVDTEAIDLMAQVTKVNIESKYLMRAGKDMDIQPTIEGVASGKLRVEWLTSSDPKVASIDYSDRIIASAAGKTTLKGIVVPAYDEITFLTTGVSAKTDWKSIIPEDKLIYVETVVEVSPSSNGSSSGGSSELESGVVVEDPENGTVTAGKVGSNGKQTFTIEADEGYEIADVIVDGKSMGAVSKVTVDKATEEHTLQVVFKKTESADPTDPTDPSDPSDPSGPSDPSDPADGWQNPYIDVNSGDWFYEAVKYNTINGIMNGVASDRFAPNDKVTRAMFVTVLYRIEGEPDAQASDFVDVPADAYYSDAVAWASDNGIVKGISETEFAPDQSITRQQAAAILYRYANYKGYGEFEATRDIRDFDDYDQIAEYALDAMEWCLNANLITGVSDTAIDPAGNATRAQMATIMMRLVENVASQFKAQAAADAQELVIEDIEDEAQADA